MKSGLCIVNVVNRDKTYRRKIEIRNEKIKKKNDEMKRGE